MGMSIKLSPEKTQYHGCVGPKVMWSNCFCLTNTWQQILTIYKLEPENDLNNKSIKRDADNLSVDGQIDKSINCFSSTILLVLTPSSNTFHHSRNKLHAVVRKRWQVCVVHLVDCFKDIKRVCLQDMSPESLPTYNGKFMQPWGKCFLASTICRRRDSGF